MIVIKSILKQAIKISRVSLIQIQVKIVMNFKFLFQVRDLKIIKKDLAMIYSKIRVKRRKSRSLNLYLRLIIIKMENLVIKKEMTILKIISLQIIFKVINLDINIQTLTSRLKKEMQTMFDILIKTKLTMILKKMNKLMILQERMSRIQLKIMIYKFNRFPLICKILNNRQK